VLDFGFYAYALISVENAARAVALQTSKSKIAAGAPDGSKSTLPATACTVALSELSYTGYGRSFPSNCRDATLDNLDPKTATCGPTDTHILDITTSLLANSGEDSTDAAQAEVKYETVTMIPIPGVIPRCFWIDRTWQMKIDPTADY